MDFKAFKDLYYQRGQVYAESVVIQKRIPLYQIVQWEDMLLGEVRCYES